MNCTRDNSQSTTWRNSVCAMVLTASSLLASNTQAEMVSIQFSQSYPGGGTVTGLLVGEDMDGDGRLYSMNPFIGGFLEQPPGDEVTYASVRIERVLGEPVNIIFDASVGDGINDDMNVFFGFAYNLDGGPLGDEENEGVSFAPLAPSTSYTAGLLFAPAVTPSVIEEPLTTCGQPDVASCSAITTLKPVEPFPAFELLFDATSPEPILTSELLRYSFEQPGFDGGASITGTVSGTDLDGDGRLYSVGAAYIDFLGYPAGDEIAFASVTIRGMAPEAIVNKVDLVTTDVLDFPNFFFGAAVNVAGAELGDEEGEGLSIAPFSPSTSYVVGELFSPSFSPSVVEQGVSNCGNAEGEPCGALLTLTPNPEVPSGVDVQATQYSAQPIALASAPFLVDSQFSGHWLNLLDGGEGVIVQITDAGKALVYWVTYDASGKQRWLFGIGRREGLKIVIDDLYVTDNGAFNAQQPVVFDLERAGEMEVEFTGCNSGVVRSEVDGVPGTMDIGRLTGLSGLECVR